MAPRLRAFIAGAGVLSTDCRLVFCLKVPPRLRRVLKKQLLSKQRGLSMLGSMHKIEEAAAYQVIVLLRVLA
jgi:hypothetical protein